MELTIIGTIIGAIITATGYILAAKYKANSEKQLEKKQPLELSTSEPVTEFTEYPPIPSDGISGRWDGKVYQVEGPDNGQPIDFKIVWRLNINESKISGDASFEWKEKPIKLLLSGHYINRGFFKIDYKDKNPKVLRYGTFFFHISSDCETLKGKFLGYAPEMENVLIYGDAEAKKHDV